MARSACRSTPDYSHPGDEHDLWRVVLFSRLNLNLRKSTATPTGNSFFDMRIEPGPFTAFAGVPDRQDSRGVQRILQRVRPSNWQCRRGTRTRQNYVSLGLPSDFETTGDIPAPEDTLVYHLPDDYYESVPNIEAVSAAPL
jgi:hypothetical protein